MSQSATQIELSADTPGKPCFVEVGTPVARRPPHRSRRAVFPHRALQNNSLSHSPSGVDRHGVRSTSRWQGIPLCLSRFAFSVMARRKVCQPCSVIHTALVACADCVVLSAPSPASRCAPCCWILRADPTPGMPESTSLGCASLPAWPSQLVRQGLSGPPSFRVSPSSLATLLDPGKPFSS